MSSVQRSSVFVSEQEQKSIEQSGGRGGKESCADVCMHAGITQFRICHEKKVLMFNERYHKQFSFTKAGFFFYSEKHY